MNWYVDLFAGTVPLTMESLFVILESDLLDPTLAFVGPASWGDFTDPAARLAGILGIAELMCLPAYPCRLPLET